MPKKHTPNPEWTRAGGRLYQQRIDLGLTQVEFAQRIGVAGNTVARWERGEIGMKPTTARLIEMLCPAKPAVASKRKL